MTLHSAPAPLADRPRSPARAVLGALGATAAVVALGVAVAGVERVYEGLVVAFGRNVPQDVIVDDYALGLVWSLVIGATIPWWPVRRGDRGLLALAWGVRVAVTLGLMLAYEWNYDFLDAYSYFRASLDPLPDPGAWHLGAGTENLNALAWWHARVLPSYHAMKVSCALAGLVAVYLLYRTACLALEREEPRVLLALAVFPSILFWSSILGKDPLVLLGIAAYLYGTVRWHVRRDPLAWGAIALGVVGAMAIRLWMGPILLAPLGVLLVRATRDVVLRRWMVALGLLVAATGLWVFRERLLQETLKEVLSTANTLSRGWAEGGSAQTIGSDLTDPVSFLAFLPKGMFTALFRPLPGEVMNPFGLLAGLENLAVLSLGALAVWRARFAEWREPLTLWATSLVLVWSAVYSVLSYQNLGTAVRFRLQILPVLLGLFAWLAWEAPRRRRQRDAASSVPTARPDLP